MNFKIVFLSLLLFSCTQSLNIKKKKIDTTDIPFISKGFALVYSDDLYDNNFFDDNSDMKTFTRESNSNEFAEPNLKRPLEAISLRLPKNLQAIDQKKLPYRKEVKNEDWPDEMDFKVERWQRASGKENNTSKDQFNPKGPSKSRNLPRSRRRRV